MTISFLAAPRMLLLASFGAYVLWFSLPLLQEIDVNAYSALMLSGAGGSIDLGNKYLAWTVFLARAVSYVGLLRARSWGAVIFMAITVLNVLLSPFGGLSVQTALSLVVGYMSTLLDGAVIAKLVKIKSEYEGLPRPEATAKSHGIEVPRLRS